MQKLRTRSQAKLYDKDLLPTLKTNSNSFMGRTLVQVSKFDLDSNMVLKQQRKLQMLSKIQRSHPKNPRSKLKNNLQIPLLSEQRIITSESKRQRQQKVQQLEQLHQTSKSLVSIESSKVSSKGYGLILGYAANSHPGIYNLVNQDRICIVTNLNKSNHKHKQISFFSIYDGSNGLLKTDYFRDHFHLILNSDQNLINQPEKAIKSAIQKIQKNLSTQLMFLEDGSKVGYALVVVIGQLAYLVISGTCQIIISKNFGGQIDKFQLNLNNNLNLTKIDQHKKIFLKKQNTLSICIKRIDLSDNLDFVLLGSEGTFENLKPEQIVKKLWTHMIKSKHENIHTCLGEATLQLLYNVFSSQSSKNASIIMLGFKNIESCFMKPLKLCLPHSQ